MQKKSIKRFIIVIVLTPLLIFTALFAMNQFFVSRYITPTLEESAKQFDLIFPRFVEDLKVIENAKLFPRSDYTKNAEPFLRDRISWNYQESTLDPKIQEVMDEYPKWNRDDGQVKALAKDKRLKDFDLAWLAELLEYDHLDLHTFPKNQESLSRVDVQDSIGRTGIYAALSLPNYSELRKLGFLYLLQKIRTKKIQKGLKLYRHVAFLSFSSSNLVGSILAKHVYKDLNHLARNGLIESKGLVSSETLAAWERVSWGWAGVFSESLNRDFPQELRTYLKPETGACAGSYESLMSTMIAADFLGDPYFFESSDTADRVTALQKLHKLTFAKCNLEPLEVFLRPIPNSARYWWGPDMSPVFFGGSPDSPLGSRKNTFNWSRLPSLRRPLGLLLLNMARPNYFRHYEDQKK